MLSCYFVDPIKRYGSNRTKIIIRIEYMKIHDKAMRGEGYHVK